MHVNLLLYLIIRLNVAECNDKMYSNIYVFRSKPGFDVTTTLGQVTLNMSMTCQ